MGGLIINEFKKMVSKKRFLVILTIMVMATVLFSCVSWTGLKDDRFPLYPEVKSIKHQIAFTSSRRDKVKLIDKKSRNEKNEAVIESLTRQLEILGEQRDLLLELDKVGSDWRSILKEDIALVEKKKAFAESEGDKSVIEDINKELIYKKFLLDKDVKYTSKPAASAFYNLPSILYYSQRVFLLLIISILMLDIVSGEQEAATIKVLLTKPVTRAKVLLSKFISITIASNGIVLAVQTLAFLLFGLFFTFGNPNTPFVKGTKYYIDYALINEGRRGISPVIGSSTVVPAWEMILQLLLLQILIITASAAFCLLISTIFKSNVPTVGAGMLFFIANWLAGFNVVFSPNQGTRTTLLERVMPYFFGTYYDLFALSTGKTSEMLLNPKVTTSLFVLVCFVWIVVCYGIAHVIFTKRDVL